MNRSIAKGGRLSQPGRHVFVALIKESLIELLRRIRKLDRNQLGVTRSIKTGLSGHGEKKPETRAFLTYKKD
jgi:hypothetical protein